MRSAILLWCLVLLWWVPSASAQLPVPCVPPVCVPGGEQPPPPQSKPPPPTPAPAPGTLEGSATTMVDPAHTGHLPDQALVPPLRIRWKRTFHENVGAPLYGDGRVYVSADGALRALDPRTGGDLWAVPTKDFVGAYDAGRVYVGTADGFIRALAAADGHELWRLQVSEYYPADATFVATGGMLYVSTPDGASQIWQVDGATGQVRWRNTGNGTANMPAVDGDRVFASYACGWTYAWNRSDGKGIWNTTADCSGGGGSTVTSYRGKVYVPEDRSVRDAASGGQLAAPADWTDSNPLFAGDVGVFPVAPSSGTTDAKRVDFRAFGVDDGKLRWELRVDAGKATVDGAASSPLIVGSTFYTLVGGRLSAHAMEDGRQVWRATVPYTGIFTGSVYTGRAMAAGPGLLLVPGGATLTAYDSIYQPAADGVAAGTLPSDVVLGGKAFVEGVVGTGLRAAGAPVAVEVDRAPFGKRWKANGTLSMRADGGFDGFERPQRNQRVRVRVGGAVASAGTVFVYPRVNLRIRGVSRTRFAVGATLRGPRGIRLAGRRAVIYLGRQKAKRFDRLGSSQLRRSSGGRVRASITHRRLRGIGRRDFVAVCVPRLHRLGLGRPTRFARRCGARRITMR